MESGTGSPTLSDPHVVIVCSLVLVGFKQAEARLK